MIGDATVNWMAVMITGLLVISFIMYTVGYATGQTVERARHAQQVPGSGWSGDT